MKILIMSKTNLNVARGVLEEVREINHHGMVVQVGEESEEKGAWEYNKDLISKDEKTQDKALR